MSIPQSIKSYLYEHKVGFESMQHPRDYTAQRTAADTHTPGKDFAKTVILFADNAYCMAVLPATYQVDLAKIKAQLHANEVSLASEEEVESLCRDCEVGAMPPFGVLYELPVYVSHHLAEDEMITFNGGTHEEVIRMRYDDFEKLVRPEILDLTQNHHN